MVRPRNLSISRRIVDACLELMEERGRARLSRAQVAEPGGREPAGGQPPLR